MVLRWSTLQIVLTYLIPTVITSIPSSPCPSVFQYVDDRQSNTLVGSLILDGIRSNYNNTVEMVLSLSTKGGYSGSHASIKLLNLDELPAEPAKFAVYFPNALAVPSVTSITFNGKQVCRGPSAEGRWATTMTLSYYVIVASSRNSVKTTRFFNRNEEFARRSTTQRPSKSLEILDEKPFDGCGKTVNPVIPLLMGGKKTNRSDWPWLGVLFYKNRDVGSVEFRCGATLISSRVLLTAGHCLLKVDGRTHLQPDDVVVSVGRHNIMEWGELTAKTSSPRDLRIHPRFSGDTFDYDIGIVTLVEPISYTASIRPVCLWSDSLEESLIVGQVGTVVGWGFSRPEGTISEVPRQVQLRIVSEVDCIRSDVGLQLTTSERTFCAGGEGSGPCQGDSGGGLFLRRPRDGHWVLRGIVSHSLLDAYTGKCDTRKYSVYTDVAKYRDWLKEQTGDDLA